MAEAMLVSALVVAHNEEARLAACLEKLGFADEIVVVLDRCTDGSKTIALSFGARIIEGAWPLEGPRRNTGIDACRGVWVMEVDADEHIPPALGEEIRHVAATSSHNVHDVPIDNYVGERLVRYGWGASFGTSARASLHRRGVKYWGDQMVHPALIWNHPDKGPPLVNRMDHQVDKDISDMIHRLDRYATLRAMDLLASGKRGSLANNLRRVLSRFFKCYVRRKGYREGGYGLLIAILASLFPLLAYLKATLEEDALRQKMGEGRR